MANLVADWLPALDGVVEKLQRGGKVADVGCGHGASTLVMAKAFPRSSFTGFDFHDASVQHANEHARDSELDNVRFEVATAKHFPGSDYDLMPFSIAFMIWVTRWEPPHIRFKRLSLMGL